MRTCVRFAVYILLPVVASSGAVLLTGCRQSEPRRTVENYFPLAIGNRWCWVDALDQTASFEFQIGDTYLLDGIKFYRYPDPSGFYDGFWLVHRDGELRTYIGSPKDTSSRQYLVLLKEPFDVGAWWTSPYDTAETTRIIDDDVTLSVPAGTFKHCLEVESNVEGSYWYAPGVGWIAFPDTSRWVLLNYTIR